MRLLGSVAAALLCLALMASPLAALAAAEEPTVVQAYTTDDMAHFFVDGPEWPGEISCAAGSQSLPVAGQGLLDEAEIPVYTAFLIDVSTSIRAGSQGTISAVLTRLIDEKPEKDRFAVFTFGEEVRTITDFSADRYDLLKAVEGLAYQDQASSLYDAVLELAQTVFDKMERTEPIYIQLVVLSDGVERSEAGIIKEELFFHLKSNPYPVHTLGFQYENNGEGLKELHAISRISGGAGIEVSAAADPQALAGELEALSGDIYWVGAKIPGRLADGSTRSVALTDGSTQILYDLKMPFVQHVAPSRAEPPPPREEASSQPEIATPQPQPQPQEKAGLPGWIWIAVAAGAVVVIVIVLVAVKGKKKPQQPQLAWVEEKEPAPVVQPPADGTQWTDDGHTQILISGGAQPGGPKLVLIDVQQANRRFEAPLTGEVVIGREQAEGGIRIDYDRSVSRSHCKVYLSGSGAWVEDLGSANKTYVNEMQVTAPAPLKDKDILRLGKVQLLVTLQTH